MARPIDKIESELDKELREVSTLNATERHNRLEKMLSDENTKGSDKIKICDYFCRKLYYILRLNGNRKRVMIETLSQTIYNDDTLPNPFRLYYLRFPNETVSYETSEILFNMGIRRRMARTPYFQILKYILKSPYTNADVQTSIINEYEEMFADPTIDRFTKMEIADTFILCGNRIRGYEMVDILRREGIDRIEQQRTVYDDNQNVHTTAINKSVLGIAVRLIEMGEKTAYDTEKVKEILGDSTVISRVLERIEIDTSTFTSGANRFNMYIAFANLWEYIMKDSQKEELLLRLREEMNGMADYCTTGHLARLVNVIQGFTDDDDLRIRISSQDQINAVVFGYLDRVLKDAPEEVMDSLVDGDEDIFYSYVNKKIQEKLPVILEDYGKVEDNIVMALNNYTRSDKFNIKKTIIMIIN